MPRTPDPIPSTGEGGASDPLITARLGRLAASRVPDRARTGVLFGLLPFLLLEAVIRRRPAAIPPEVRQAVTRAPGASGRDEPGEPADSSSDPGGGAGGAATG